MMRFGTAGKQVALLLAVVFVGSACTKRSDQAGRRGDQIIEESYTRESQNLGTEAQKEGETEIRGQREVIQKRTEQVREKVPTIIVGERKADLNRMEVKDFRALGLSERASKNAVDFREKHKNGFSSVEQLKQVPEMDMVWLESNQSYLGVSNPS